MRFVLLVIIAVVISSGCFQSFTSDYILGGEDFKIFVNLDEQDRSYNLSGHYELQNSRDGSWWELGKTSINLRPLLVAESEEKCESISEVGLEFFDFNKEDIQRNLEENFSLEKAEIRMIRESGEEVATCKIADSDMRLEFSEDYNYSELIREEG